MIKLKNLITEGWFEPDLALKPHEKLLVGSVTEFMKNRLNISAKMIVKKKNNNGMIGDVPLSHNSVNNNKFYVHFNPNTSNQIQIEALIHELTHVKQISKKELQPTSDWTGIEWQGKFFISAKDYNKILKGKQWATYVKFPWEQEASKNQKGLYSSFLKSNELASVRGKDSTFDDIIDNL